MGHVKNYTMGDVVTLFRRRNGHRVMHPMGYDAFGLPAENAAIKIGPPPGRVDAREHRRDPPQMKRMGWSIDWTREVSTCEPEYYRWTQWIFLRLFEAGLAYRKSAAVKWCPIDQTVLANEQVIDGRCERCGTQVEAKNAGAVVLQDHRLRAAPAGRPGATCNWPERVVTMQRNWIGRREGAEVAFALRRRHRAAGLHDAARHALRRDVLRAGAGASAGRPSWRAGTSTSRCGGRLRPPRRGAARRSSAPRRQREDRRLHRPLRRSTR